MASCWWNSTAAQIKDSLDKQADFQKFASQVAESQAQEEAAKAKDETELKQAEDELGKDDLEMRRNEVLRVLMRRMKRNWKRRRPISNTPPDLRSEVTLPPSPQSAFSNRRGTRPEEDMIRAGECRRDANPPRRQRGGVAFHLAARSFRPGSGRRPGARRMSVLDVVDPFAMVVQQYKPTSSI